MINFCCDRFKQMSTNISSEFVVSRRLQTIKDVKRKDASMEVNKLFFKGSKGIQGTERILFLWLGNSKARLE